MEKLTQIGLEKKTSIQVAENLNTLLATYHLYYQNMRGFHWNIKGPAFFQLHEKFEELYTEALAKIDALAERILTLGSQPLHTFSAYLEHSAVKEAQHLSTAPETVGTTLENQKAILELEREIMAQAAEHGDEGTLGLLAEDVHQIEKNIWMLSAYNSK